MATAVKLGRGHDAQRVTQVLKNHVPMLLWGDGQCVQCGVNPQHGLFDAASRSPGFAQLLGEHEQHLAAVLVPESRRIAVEQRSVDGWRARHAGHQAAHHTAHLGTRHEPGRSRLSQQRIQPLHFGRCSALAETREPVVAPPLVGAQRVRTFRQLFNQTLLEHTADGAVQRPGAQLDFAFGPGCDILHDGVAVTVAAGERDQDVEDRRRAAVGGNLDWDRALRTILDTNIASSSILVKSRDAGVWPSFKR